MAKDAEGEAKNAEDTAVIFPFISRREYRSVENVIPRDIGIP
jgi:hypothetical protein